MTQEQIEEKRNALREEFEYNGIFDEETGYLINLETALIDCRAERDRMREALDMIANMTLVKDKAGVLYLSPERMRSIARQALAKE